MQRFGEPEEIGELRSVHLLRHLRIYDCGHGLCERRRRMALTGVWCGLATTIAPEAA